MSIWLSIIIAGLFNYFTRLASVLIINPNKMNNKTKLILTYVPSSVFPAIIFPAIFLEQNGMILNFYDPKIIAISIAFLIGFITKNLILTIFSGLTSFWILMFWLIK